MVLAEDGAERRRQVPGERLEGAPKLWIPLLPVVFKLVYGLRENDAPVPLLELSKELRELIDRAIYQTHNFVIRFHRQVRGREFIPE